MPQPAAIKVRVQAIVLGSSWDTKYLASRIEEMNDLYKSAGVTFEFDPNSDSEFEPTDLFQTDPTGILATNRAMQYRGKLVIYLRAGGEGIGHFSGPGEYVHIVRDGFSGGKLAHEVGHYFLLYHTFVEGLTLPEVADKIRKAVENHPVVMAALAAGEPIPDQPTGELAEDVMSVELNGDDKPQVHFPVTDTPAAIHSLPPGYTNACLPGLGFDFDVAFSNGQSRTFTFVPDQANLLGYAHDCANLPRYLSPQQVDIVRASLRVGSRAHLGRGPAWHALDDQPGPSAVAWGKGHLDLFARFPDGTVRSKSWDQARDGWWPNDIDWFNLGGQGFGVWPPAAVSFAPGRVDVFAIFKDGDVFMKSWDKVTGNWSPSDTGWFPLGGTAFAPLSVVSWGNGHLDLFARFADGTIRSKVWDKGGLGWWPSEADWFSLLPPGQLS